MRYLYILLFIACTARVPSKAEVPNFHRVDATVWRSAQPTTAEQWRQIRAVMGPSAIVIKLDCESEGSDNLARLEGFDVRDLCINPRTDLSDAVDMASTVISKPDGQRMGYIEEIITNECRYMACLVHCVHGKDRTGVVVAMARVILDGWTKDQAIEEAQRIGMRPFPGLLRWWHDWRPVR